jgi:hypothetical protein
VKGEGVGTNGRRGGFKRELGLLFAGVSSVYGGLRRRRLVILGGFSGAASCTECREQAVGVGGWLCREKTGRVQWWSEETSGRWRRHGAPG